MPTHFLHLWIANAFCLHLWIVNALCTPINCQRVFYTFGLPTHFVHLWIVNALCTPMDCQRIVYTYGLPSFFTPMDCQRFLHLWIANAVFDTYGLPTCFTPMDCQRVLFIHNLHCQRFVRFCGSLHINTANRNSINQPYPPMWIRCCVHIFVLVCSTIMCCDGIQPPTVYFTTVRVESITNAPLPPLPPLSLPTTTTTTATYTMSKQK